MKKLFLSIVLIMFSFIVFGQWNQQFGWPNQFNSIKTNGTVKSVGVGDFDSQWNIKARLHVNSNLMPDEWDWGFWWWNIHFDLHYNRGNLFRTDGSNAVENNWTMWTGPTGNTTEKAKLFVSTAEGADDFSIQASIDDMIFNTGGPLERARILGSNGYVGINTPTPTDRVEINSAISEISGLTFTQLDNSVTPLANPSNGVLSLDENGRVIWVEGAGGGGVDNDWFIAGTILPGANIDDNIYTQGFTGLGDFSTIIPQSLLHLYQPDAALYAQFTNDNTNNTVTDGFLVGINEDGVAQLNQQENEKIDIFTNDIRRMRIWHTTDNNARVGIGINIIKPLTYLHIGEQTTFPATGGYRDWMNIGTFYVSQTDNMYVGIRHYTGDKNDAIINWGNNPIPSGSADRLRFVFTSCNFADVPASGYEGLETARMVTDGINGRVGIGGYPAGIYGGNPFENLYYWGSEDPTQTLEVNSPDTYVEDAPGFSGLRFTDLRENSSHVPLNPDQGVLSVNEEGDVIYVDAAGGGAVDNDWFIAGTILPGANIDDNIYTQGFTGLGDFSTIIPQSLLHLYQPDAALYAQFTNDNTNNTVTDGFLVGINEDGVAQLNQQENEKIDIFTNDIRRMRIWHSSNDNARVGIGPNIIEPATFLHIGDPVSFNQAGHRDWMNVGTLSVTDSDNMYVGMRHYAIDQNEAIINWGNNPGLLPGADRLRFIFTAFRSSNVPANGDDGLEIARMVSDGINGRVGIGGFPSGHFYNGNPFPANPYSIGENPGATLEVNSPETYVEDAPGFSGLRFTDLRENSSHVPLNPDQGVLSVNEEGDVIYVDAAGGGAGDDDWERMDEDIFTGTDGITMPDLATGNVGIGYPPIPPIEPHYGNTKLTVVQGAVPIDDDTTRAVRIYNINPATLDNINYGIDSKVFGNYESGEPTHIAGRFQAENATENYGIKTESLGGTHSSNGYGIWAEASGSVFNYGIYATVSTASDAAGYFNGNIDGVGSFNFSDQGLKQNIQNISNATDIIKKLRPVSFYFDTLNYPQINFNKKINYGLIAQEVDTVLPAINKNSVFPAQYDNLGNQTSPEVHYKSTNYVALIPFLIKTVQEQQSIIEYYETKFNYYDSLLSLFNYYDSLLSQFNYHNSLLSQCCNQCCNINNDSINPIQIEDNENFDNNILYQNRPNPFSKKTEINYYLAENVINASILIFDMQGILVKNYNLSTFKGKGKLTINGYELTPGMYFYSLIVNDKEIGTKRMILTD